MIKNVNRTWFFIFGGIFILLLFSNLLFPITYDDDFAYALAGNPFALQWAERYTTHGRLITHTIARIILQWGFPFTDIAASFFALGVFIAAYLQVQPRFIENPDRRDYFFFGALFIILYAFVPMSSTAYGMTIFFMSNIFAVGLVLLFLAPYGALLAGTDLKPRALLFTAFLAGASQEQAVAVLPLLAGLWLVLRSKKSTIPRWFWAGFLFFCLGYLVIALSPITYSQSRLMGYGGAENWTFMGQSYNWVELGWKRHLYSLIGLLFLDRISAYIPNTIAYYAVIVILYWRLVKKLGFSDSRLMQAVFYIVASWGFTAIMMFSPLYYQANLIWGLIPLWVALIILLKAYFEEFQHRKFFLALFCTLSAAGAIIWGVQVFAWNHYRKEYKAVAAAIEEAKAQNAPQVEVLPFTQFAIPTPLGNIYPVYLSIEAPVFMKEWLCTTKAPKLSSSNKKAPLLRGLFI